MTLDDVIAGLASLEKSGARDITQAVEGALQAELETQYQTGVGPDGEPWADKADGTASRLQKTGRMRANTRAVRGVSGVDVKVPKPGGFHQSGTRKMPARKIVPDEGDPLPPRWDAAVTDSATRVIERALRA